MVSSSVQHDPLTRLRRIRRAHVYAYFALFALTLGAAFFLNAPLLVQRLAFFVATAVLTVMNYRCVAVWRMESTIFAEQQHVVPADASSDENENVLRQNYKAAFQDAFGHKPWTTDDKTFFSLRCMCRLYDAVTVAEPCSHLVLCLACYMDVRARGGIFLKRCPKCAKPVTHYRGLEE